MTPYPELLKQATPLPWKPEIIDEIDNIPEAQQEANFKLMLHSTEVLPQALEALKLAQLWLSNCVTVCKVDAQEPLPVIASTIAAIERVKP